MSSAMVGDPRSACSSILCVAGHRVTGQCQLVDRSDAPSMNHASARALREAKRSVASTYSSTRSVTTSAVRRMCLI